MRSMRLNELSFSIVRIEDGRVYTRGTGHVECCIKTELYDCYHEIMYKMGHSMPTQSKSCLGAL
jgi:hypothetical protein